MGIFWNDNAIQRIERRLDAIAQALINLQKGVTNMDDILADLKKAVEETKAGEASAIALVNGLAEKIDALVAASGNTVDPSAVAALAADLRASAADLGAAVVADAR